MSVTIRGSSLTTRTCILNSRRKQRRSNGATTQPSHRCIGSENQKPGSRRVLARGVALGIVHEPAATLHQSALAPRVQEGAPARQPASRDRVSSISETGTQG